MASKGPRSRVDHESRVKRQKALEPPREPPRPKTHWDVVLEEMVWLSKDFESERKWKLSHAKKVAIRASKSILEHATKGEKKVKEEEQRLRKVALNISKDIKKFWTKIEKLVIYKHQLECEERKKKALDKQLDFLLGQTERYSTMLAENLVDKHHFDSAVPEDHRIGPPCNSHNEMDEDADVNSDAETPSDNMELDDEYGIRSEDDSEDDEHTIEEDEALITEEERREELAALQVEVDLPLEELLKRYNSIVDVNIESFPDSGEDVDNSILKRKDQIKDADNQANGALCVDNLSRETEFLHEIGDDVFNDEVIVATSNSYNLEKMRGKDSISKRKSRLNNSRPQWESLTLGNCDDLPVGSCDEGEDRDYMIAGEDEKDDETTLAEEEELSMKESNDPLDEVKLLQQESEISVEELLSRYKQDAYSEVDSDAESCYTSSNSDDQSDHPAQEDIHRSDSDNGNPSNNQKMDNMVQRYLKTETDAVIDGKSEEEKGTEDIIEDAAAAARSAQPTGNTFSTTKVRTKFPFLLKHSLREYQHIGLDWLVTMFEKRLNGILADEMGLGKTIMTISLLAHLACEKGIWGPHLIVVPTSVMLNWETEFLKWCPAFKILTYFGSAKERKQKRQGWLKLNSFHVCITTYRLVIQDSKVFKRKKWKYLILDEAHLIKNWKSQRWQTLLNFNSKRRILLTGTPLQNDLMELWSLMHFLMPHIFQSHQEFKEWFSNPITCMVDGQEKVNKDVVDRLHNVLRPFLLRRLKRDVEKQLPQKHEHAIYCRLSKRQRNLYEEFIASSETQATLASTNFFAMISVIMQLRKVCNHPDLFEGRPIVSSFDMAGIDMQLSSTVCSVLCADPFSKIDLKGLNLIFTQHEFDMTSWEIDEIAAISAVPSISASDDVCVSDKVKGSNRMVDMRRVSGSKFFEEIQRSIWEERMKEAKERAAAIAWWNSLQCQKKPVYGTNLREIISFKHPVLDIHELKNNPSCYMNFSSKLADLVLLPVQRMHSILDFIECFMFAIPAARSPSPQCWSSKGNLPVFLPSAHKEEYRRVFSPLLSPIRPAIVRRQVYFPDRRLIQFDCGKLQELAILLRRLKSEGHRALIFTQMTKMLDILEAFINLYGYTYMRLDGSTQPEERQTLMQRFNTNPKFFLFILSTRSGGVGINLVGADTVIFYDSDWNPAMDQQAQDRCHRIGQTREVHIYRLISESTIEENILKKANQKRALDNLVIQSGSYNTDFFKKLNPVELFSGHQTLHIQGLKNANAVTVEGVIGGDASFSNADVEAALKQAEDEADYMALKKVEEEEAVDNQEFTEDAIGREEDDLINDDDVKVDGISAEERGFQNSTVFKDAGADLLEDKLREEKTLMLAAKEEDIDMLTDVKQLAAAAAAAGEASSSFENQLRPIDRYAMRFLDLWDPIIDKSEVEYEAHVEEEQWELDRIQKFKEDLEAEIDEDEEPFLYERWDAEFATEAYKHHVEALAQQQLLEEQEREANEANTADDGNAETVRADGAKPRKSKSKKSKKAKSKSLKKKSVASDIEPKCDVALLDSESNDEKDPFHEVSYLDSPLHASSKKKRKDVASDEENVSKKKMKKLKKPSEAFSAINSDSSDKHSTEGKELKYIEGTTDIDFRPVNRSKMGGKISITVMPIKRIMVVKPEKLKKKVNVWSKDCIPSPDIWSSQEDAVLCAAVHEYGAHWNLVSDVLYSISGGGFYRGRFRHPAHCCERFRDLFSRYILSTTEGPNAEKMNAFNSGKALLKVTEDQIDLLLNVASELPDTELLLQKHFMAVLSSVWRAKCRLDYRQDVSSSHKRVFNKKNSSLHGYKTKRFIEKAHFAKLRQNSKIVAAALNDVLNAQQEPFVTCNQVEALPDFDQVELTLEISNDIIESACPFPSVVSLSIRSPEALCSAEESSGSSLHQQSCRSLSEERFRLAWETCLEGEAHGWASSAFPTCEFGRPRSVSKPHSVGKLKPSGDPGKSPKSKVPRTTESDLFSSSQHLMTSPDYFDAAIFSETHMLLDSDDSNDYHLLSTEVSVSDLLIYEAVTCEYDPNFIANLEELDSLDDIPEVG